MILLLPIAALLLVILCVFRPSPALSILQRFQRFLRRASARPVRNMLLTGLLAFLLHALMTLSTHWPAPGIHDEYSYLLAADTFSQGRLTHPMHPLWEHFESFHIIVQPTYASKYPPAQGMLLALGQSVTDRPIVGAWIGQALACVALYWALLAWLPGRWALLGGLLAVVHPLMLEWGQCFWGGAAATIGGALIAGSARRIARPGKPRISDAAWLAAGLLTLANSRPLEGFICAALLMSWLAVALVRKINARKITMLPVITRTALPLTLVLGAGFTWMAYYNYRVTGEPLKLPYMEHEKAYAMTPLFVWQQARPEPTYRHEVIKRFWTGWALDFHQRQQTLKGWAIDGARKAWTASKAYLWQLVMVVPTLAGLAAIRRHAKARLATGMLAGYALLLFNQSWPLQPHYAAPFLIFVLLLEIHGLRLLLQWRPHSRLNGPALVAALLAACLLSPVFFWKHHRLQSPGNVERVRMIHQLSADGRKHIVIVRYAEDHSPHDEWVYNEADIPESKVVWARDMGASRNRRLIEHFVSRTFWLLEPDKKPRTLVPYAVE